MEKNYIVCTLDHYVLNHNIYMTDGEQLAKIGSAPFFDVAKVIKAGCDKYSIPNVHLFGNIIYIKPIIDELKLQTDFNNNPINVEVN